MARKASIEKKPFFKNVIVGADFSTHSKKVFQGALSLAKKWKLNVVLAHVSSPVSYFDPEGLAYIVSTQSWKTEKVLLEKKLKNFYKFPRGSRVKMIVKQGSPAESLVAVAKKFKNPLILVGHTEKGAFSRWALGSVSQELATIAPVPVWIQ